MWKKVGTLLGAFVAAATLSAEAPKKATSGLDDVLRAAVTQRRVPYVVAMVATPDGVAYQGAFGADQDAIFAIASMTKPITSVAVMQLVEAGKVKLDEPAATYVPELAAVEVLDGQTLRAPRTPVTVRHLLTHTSGFGYEFLNKPLLDLVAQKKVASLLAGGDGFLKAPLVLDPGERWVYGINTDWLGRLVERVSGQSLDAYLRQRVFEPLGMNDTYFNVPPEKQARLLKHHHRLEDGGLQEDPPAPVAPVVFFSGGGGLYSTASDYLTFARALLAGGQLGKARILTAESVALMGRNQIGELVRRSAPSLMPQLLKDAPLPGRPDKFGYGFALNSSPLEGRGANTLSWAGIHNTFFWIDREKGLCAVLMTQMLPFLDEGPRAAMEDFERAVYAWRD
jgi:CubicO group peptidase (beta-lactamase class C family)